MTKIKCTTWTTSFEWHSLVWITINIKYFPTLHKIWNKRPLLNFYWSVWIWNFLKDLEFSLHFLVETQNWRDVSTAITIIWDRPNSNQCLLWEVIFVPLHHQLVRATYQLNSINTTELSQVIRAQFSIFIISLPLLLPLIQRDTQHLLVTVPILLYPLDRTTSDHNMDPGEEFLELYLTLEFDLLIQEQEKDRRERKILCPQSTASNEFSQSLNYTWFTYSSQIQVVKHFHAVFPGICISIFSHAFFIEAIHLCNLSWLVISSKKSDISWIPTYLWDLAPIATINTNLAFKQNRNCNVSTLLWPLSTKSPCSSH